jgi:hypothetical protein
MLVNRGWLGHECQKCQITCVVGARKPQVEHKASIKGMSDEELEAAIVAFGASSSSSRQRPLRPLLSLSSRSSVGPADHARSGARGAYAFASGSDMRLTDRFAVPVRCRMAKVTVVPKNASNREPTGLLQSLEWCERESSRLRTPPGSTGPSRPAVTQVGVTKGRAFAEFL